MAEKEKSEIWSQEDEQFFFERYAQAGNNQPSLLLIDIPNKYCTIVWNVLICAYGK